MLLSEYLDAADFYHATIFDNDPESGLGGWGDPANDYQITTGGFSKDFIVSYPTPHNIRRNLTLQPFLNPDFWGTVPAAVLDEYINTTFTQAVLDSVVDSFVGDFEDFQTTLQGISVSTWA